MDVTHAKETVFTSSTSIDSTNTFETKPCRINIPNLLMSFNYNIKLQIYNDNFTNAIPYCNKNDFIKIKVKIYVNELAQQLQTCIMYNMCTHKCMFPTRQPQDIKRNYSCRSDLKSLS